MSKSLHRRLEAALAASHERENADYRFFYTSMDEGGRSSFRMLDTGEEMDTEAFLALVASKPDTAFVALGSSRDRDEEFVAYMEERDAYGPQSLAEMEAENAAVGDPAKLAAIEAEYEARRQAGAKTERARLAGRYAERLDVWGPFLRETQARVDRNRERRAGRR